MLTPVKKKPSSFGYSFIVSFSFKFILRSWSRLVYDIKSLLYSTPLTWLVQPPAPDEAIEPLF